MIAVAERTTDAPAPTKPGPDKPAVVSPVKAPDTKKPTTEVVEPPKEPVVAPEPEYVPRRQPR
jgi:hypothetical protein